MSGRVYDRKCDISPDGRLFIYFCGKFNTKLGTFTAVCRPPNFTALALWPEGGTYGGGGFFETNRRVVLNYGYVIEKLDDGTTLPKHLEVTALGDFQERFGDDPHHPLAHQGWELVRVGTEGEPNEDETMRYGFVQPWLHRKRCPRRPTLSLERAWLGMFEVNGPSCVYQYALVEGDARRELGRLDWAGWDHDGTLLFSQDGCLLRQTVGASLRHPSAHPAVQLEDFREDRFANILPTADAKRWP